MFCFRFVNIIKSLLFEIFLKFNVLYIYITQILKNNNVYAYFVIII